MQKLTLRLLTCAAMLAFTAAAPWPLMAPAALAQQSEPEIAPDIAPGSDTTDEAESAEADAEEEPFSAEDTQSFAGAFLAARTADYDSDTGSAIGFYSRALAFDPENVELQQRLMIAHFAEGNFEDGLELAEELKDDETIQRVTVLARGVAAIRDGNFDEAVSILTYEGPNEFDQLMNGLMLAWAQFGAGDAEAALATVDGLQGSELFAVFVNFHGGAIAEADGNLAEARARYTAAVTDTVGRGAAADTFMRAVMALATLEAREGDRQAALDVISTGEGVAPGYAPLNALRQTIEAGEPVETNSESAAEGAAAVLYTVAAALNREGAEETVALYLQFSRVLNPDDAGTLVMLGGLAESLGKPERGDRHLRERARRLADVANFAASARPEPRRSGPDRRGESASAGADRSRPGRHALLSCLWQRAFRR
jgi:predicted negative regulator of RcsB-dependent stress response